MSWGSEIGVVLMAIWWAAVIVALVASPPRWDPAIRLKEWLERRK